MDRITRGAARIASVSGLRQILSTGALAVTAVVVARTLGPRQFGTYVGGTSAYNLALGFTDLGFTLVLLREMARPGRRPRERGRIFRAVLFTQLWWSITIAVVLAAVGVITGGQRGMVMVVLSPAIALVGVTASRQLLAFNYRAAPLLLTDVPITLAQAGAVIGLAADHAGVVALAAAVSLASCLNSVIVLRLARSLVPPGRRRRRDWWIVLRGAIPAGVASILATLYFTLDQVILTWLVIPRDLGHYAASVRLLSVVVMIPGFVMSAGLPGLAQNARDPAQMSRFAATLTHWLTVTALPLCVALFVFAHPAIDLAFGTTYGASIGLLRILMIAAVLSLVSNITGIILMSLAIVRPQIAFNTVSLVVNIAGNLILVPRDGVTASAWLTVASEAIVVGYGIVYLRRRLDRRLIARTVAGPVLAVLAGAGAGVALGGDSIAALAASIAAFLLALTAFRGWPAGLDPVARVRRVGTEPLAEAVASAQAEELDRELRA